ncbi:MAG TPA: sigma-70 family RNA polymerase sigma factor [Acidimicrobiia bacterium]|nr:sigma-70 family RNA polymerase sigma factor [Acidimicrobiia bacterium]
MSEGHESRIERFRALYDTAYPRMMAYALRRARTREDALDVVSETMLTVWRRLDEIPTDRRRLPWVYAVARRVLANHYRTVARRDRLAARVVHEPGSATPEFDAVHQALDALRPDHREILTLTAWDDLDNDEIAVVLGITPAAVAVRLHRARARLARELGRLGVTGDVEKSPQSGGRSRTLEGMNGIQPGPMEKERT